jgi:L-2-hydroxyglutarate oxidase LhgO
VLVICLGTHNMTGKQIIKEAKNKAQEVLALINIHKLLNSKPGEKVNIQHMDSLKIKKKFTFKNKTMSEKKTSCKFTINYSSS